MTSRTERCGWCSVQLLVPAEAQSVRCAVCQGVTSRVQPYDTLSHVRDSINQAANRIINKVSTTVTGSVGSYPTAGSYGYNSACYNYVKPPRQMGVSSGHGRKRAVVCGVSYKGTSYKLKGSINDVHCIRFFLVEKMGFSTDSILMLTEDETNPLRIPTKENMRRAMRWLVEGCEAGDSLVFHFSGHGSKVCDDEMEGHDDALCPLDYETQGMISGDEINQTIVRPLPKGATLHAIIDACYSGSILNLPFACKMNREGYYTWGEQICSSEMIKKGTSGGGLALCFSACTDDQISVDTTALAGNAATGALTYSLIQAVENEPSLTYGRLLNAMRHAIRSAKTSGLRLSGPIASLINRTLFNTELAQEPQLSSSEKFDIYSKHFVL